MDRPACGFRDLRQINAYTHFEIVVMIAEYSDICGMEGRLLSRLISLD